MKKIFYCILALSVFAGCYKDESSDRYDPIGAIEITGIEEEYILITLADALKITPEITSTSPTDNVDGFEYLWTCYNNTEASSTLTVVDTVAHTKDVTWDITLKPGDYTVGLRVTNPANGYAVYQTTTLIVGTVFSNGFYFLKETAGGNTELDFHKPDEAGGWIIAPDILERQFGAPITGEPTSLGMFSMGIFSFAPPYPYINKENGQPEAGTVLIPMGGRDMKVMLLDDMSLVYDHNEIFFSGKAPDHKPLRAFYLSLFGYPVFIFDDGVYAVDYESKTGKVGYPVAPPGGCSFSHGMMVGDDGSFMGVPLGSLWFFDELNGQLVYYGFDGGLISLSGNNGISPTGITHRPLFMGSSGWCVFNDPNTPDRYLYLLNTDVFGTAAAEPILEIRPVTTAPNFSSAEIYGSNKTQMQFLYGSIGDRLYMYNADDDTEKQLALSGFGAGEEITMITHKRGVHNPTDRTDTAGYLFIATHKGGHYKVYMYKVTGGEPDGAPVIVEGTGKVADMQYAGGTTIYESSLGTVY
jgi:hypothetical protein